MSCDEKARFVKWGSSISCVCKKSSAKKYE